MNTSIRALTTAQVVRVYSGKPGCGCGCRGTYRYSKAGAIAEDRLSGRDVNEAQARKILRLIQDAAEVDATTVEVSDGIIALETDKRYYWVYLMPGVDVSSSHEAQKLYAVAAKAKAKAEAQAAAAAVIPMAVGL